MAAEAVTGAALPELASVPWRAPETAASLRRRGRLWTASAALHCFPFLAAAVGLVLLNPVATPVALAALAHAWIIPELYAARGARVTHPKGSNRSRSEVVAQGLLGDLLGHDERDLQRRTGLALERARLGVWLIGEAGALLVTHRGRRVHCFCVGVSDPDLPPSDRIAHLLLALRTDEEGFATVANHAFAGAAWRVRRRLDRPQRPALDAARRAAVNL